MQQPENTSVSSPELNEIVERARQDLRDWLNSSYGSWENETIITRACEEATFAVMRHLEDAKHELQQLRQQLEARDAFAKRVERRVKKQQEMLEDKDREVIGLRHKLQAAEADTKRLDWCMCNGWIPNRAAIDEAMK